MTIELNSFSASPLGAFRRTPTGVRKEQDSYPKTALESVSIYDTWTRGFIPGLYSILSGFPFRYMWSSSSGWAPPPILNTWLSYFSNTPYCAYGCDGSSGSVYRSVVRATFNGSDWPAWKAKITITGLSAGESLELSWDLFAQDPIVFDHTSYASGSWFDWYRTNVWGTLANVAGTFNANGTYWANLGSWAGTYYLAFLGRLVNDGSVPGQISATKYGTIKVEIYRGY
jgi:hypothetical protein